MQRLRSELDTPPDDLAVLQQMLRKVVTVAAHRGIIAHNRVEFALGVDAAPTPHYLKSMHGFLRTILLALILAFAAGTVLHVASATAMDLAMAAAPSTDTQMPGCDGCDDGSGSAIASCAALCAVPPVAPPAGPHLVFLVPPLAEPIPAVLALAGLTGSPDLHPPRVIVLS
ncbi:hypothetical protein HB662_27430 [Roseomonas frigidaquae]|uniref:Uncharacterized protein n=1 Tax=Falsiroseomonas frigidaquae TaxID=487318 RepID=A0ABX1F8A9_9PROT|nr:hypothetical protein [Falsiroseomonas frigidaquae]NKE48532.1 hypothetical protein [Falsiroseomonas frigidaquae]